VRGVGQGDTLLRRAVGVCARALAARALLRWVVGRLPLVKVGWARLGAAGAGLDAELATFAWCLNCPILAGALRVGFW
jgi:hypothetical protein